MTDELEAELAARDYAVDDAALDAYVERLGQMGGAAACVAIGAAPAAPLCSYLGGEIAKAIKAAVPIAKGSTFDDMIADTWAVVSAKAKASHRRLAAVRAYLARRDAVLEGIPQAARLAASAELAARGAHDVPELWRPTKKNWQAWLDFAQAANAGEPAKKIAEAKRAQQILGVPWPTYHLLVYSPWTAPVGQPGERVDWSAVAAEPYAIEWARKARARLDLWAPVVAKQHPHTLLGGGGMQSVADALRLTRTTTTAALPPLTWPVLPW